MPIYSCESLASIPCPYILDPYIRRIYILRSSVYIYKQIEIGKLPICHEGCRRELVDKGVWNDSFYVYGTQTAAAAAGITDPFLLAIFIYT